MQIQSANTRESIQNCYEVVRELRPHLTETQFIEQTLRQQNQGYHLAYIAIEGTVKGILGYRIQEFLAWGKILYIDDLATLSSARGHGYAGHLLNWIKEQAQLANCDQIHLDSGHQRFDAHRLYLNHGFHITSHHFVYKLKNNSN